MIPKDYREGHEKAMEHARKHEYSSVQKESPMHQAGYKQGLTQAHNLNISGARRLSRKEHEQPHWGE